MDDSFIQAHNLSVKTCDEATVAQLKTCVVGEWPQFNTNTDTPSADRIRLIYLGKILDDSQTLESLGISNGVSNVVSSVVHVSVRPESFQMDGKKEKKARGASRSGSLTVSGGGVVEPETEQSRCGCCVVA